MHIARGDIPRKYAQMAKTPRQNKKQRLLSVGDVLKTNPLEGYWGCAVVLSARDKTVEFDPMCHIGITTTVFTHDYALDELPLSDLRILTGEEEIYDADTRSNLRRPVTCIGIYARKLKVPLDVITNIDPTFLCAIPLQFEIGTGIGEGWPLRGPVTNRLGYEAVHAWRSVHDYEQWQADVAAGRKSHQEMLARLAEQRRQARERKRKQLI
jgi:hypothetical protein